MTRGRAYRRHHYRRIYDKWVRIGTSWGLADEDGVPFSHGEGFHGWVVRTAGNMPVCSKPWCCGNPRGMGEKTWQERRADENEREQRREYEKEGSSLNS